MLPRVDRIAAAVSSQPPGAPSTARADDASGVLLPASSGKVPWATTWIST